MNDETISLIAHEAMAARYTKWIRRIAVGWTASVVLFAAAICVVIVR